MRSVLYSNLTQVRGASVPGRAPKGSSENLCREGALLSNKPALASPACAHLAGAPGNTERYGGSFATDLSVPPIGPCKELASGEPGS